MKPTTLITGAASGVGRVLADRLAKKGHALYLTDRNDYVRDVAQELVAQGVTAWAETADLANETDLMRLAHNAQEKLQGCSNLVNCGGMTIKLNGESLTLEALTVDDWDKVQRVNLLAPVILCRELIPAMARNGYGRVVNVATRAGRMHVPPAGLEYHASKAGLIGVSRALAGIYADRGVTVNCVAPGRVDTAMSKATSPARLAQAKAAVPMGRFASADEIAATIEFLLSPEASYITGTCLDVNGGVYMN